jgi:hypothetical protein
VPGYYGSRVEHFGAGRWSTPFKLAMIWQKRRAASFFKVSDNSDRKPETRPGTRSDLPGRHRKQLASCRFVRRP